MPEAETTRCPANSNASTRFFFTSGSSTASTTMSHPANNAQAEGPSRARGSSRRMTDGFSSRKTVPSASTFGNPKCRGKKCWRFKLDNATTSGSAITKSRIPVRAKKTAQLEPNPPAPAMPMRADANTLHCSAARCPSNTASQPTIPSIPHLIHNIPHNGTPAERPPRQSKVLRG